MDRKTFFEKIKGFGRNRLKWGIGLAGTIAIVMIGVLGFVAGPQIIRHGKVLFSSGQDKWSVTRLVETYFQAMSSAQEKFHNIQLAEVENERLRFENTHLRMKLEQAEFNCRAKEAASATKDYEAKLNAKTGSKIGRTLASINYKPPGHLMPNQLYTLGLSYFKAREDEKAAVIFTFLTNLDDSETFKTPKSQLLTGIAWYRLENFELADFYFDQVLKAQETADNVQYLAQARLWRGLAAKRTNQYQKAQHWMRELVDHHPYSVEAAWINPSQEAKKKKHGPASDE